MNTFYVGLTDGLLIIQETVTGFDVSRHLTGMKMSRLAIDLSDRKRIFVATNEGLWRTENKGATWERVDHEFISSKVTAVAVSPYRNEQGNHTIYAGTEPSYLYYSENLGASWTESDSMQKLASKKHWAFPPRPDTHFIRWITPSATDANQLALSIEAGAVISTNNTGATWTDRAKIGPVDVHTLLTHPLAPHRLYAANGGLVSNKSRESYAESEDGGASWNFMSEGLADYPYLYNMTIHRERPDYRLVSASENAAGAHRQSAYSTIYRKIGDEPWQELANGLPRERAFSHHLANDPNNADAFYALNNFGLYHLEDGKDIWEKVAIPWSDELTEQRPYFFVVD